MVVGCKVYKSLVVIKPAGIGVVVVVVVVCSPVGVLVMVVVLVMVSVVKSQSTQECVVVVSEVVVLSVIDRVGVAVVVLTIKLSWLVVVL